MAAKKRTQTAQIVRATPVFAAPRQQAPIIRIAAPRAVSPTKKRAKVNRKRGHSTSPANLMHTAVGVAVGGAVIGFAENKFGSSLPNIPIVGRKGALTIVAYMLAKSNIGGGIMRDAALAGAAICGYQLGAQGTISGEGDY